jgi:diguanylate cyclase (GGDEF)-like protein
MTLANIAAGSADLDLRARRMENRFWREREARLTAERLLESKSRELFLLTEELSVLNAELEERVRERTAELETARREALTLAERDPLTDLANRFSYTRRLSRLMEKTGRQEGTITLLLVDLDRFKDTNDTLGHDAGDFLLTQVGKRLRACTRAMDLVARLGGDEFAVIVDGIEGRLEVTALAQRIVDALSKPFVYRGQRVFSACSIGIARCPDEADTAEDLQRCADLALYDAKSAGRGRWAFFRPELLDSLKCRHALERDLREAIASEALEVWYQPKVSGCGARITGVEALLRWLHPTQGLLAPDRFFPIAEASGLIDTLGDFVLLRACRQTAAWRRQDLVPEVAVNVSPSQFRDPLFVDRVRGIVVETGLPYHAVQLEITEHVLLEERENAVSRMQELARLGIRFALDDFGTGYSNLSYLRQLPLHALKIDRSFICDLEQRADARAIAHAISRLGHALGLSVVAEGVETEAQWRLAVELGCDEIQGFLAAKPAPADACHDLLRHWRGAGARSTAD